MAQQLSITIPDSLAERLAEVKGRFNVSGVCASAIAHEVERQELLAKGTEDMEDVVERLREEKKAYCKGSRDDGLKAGLSDARGMEYAELRELGDAAGGGQVDVEHYPGIVRGSSCWGNWFRYEVEERAKDYESGSFDENLYLTGWLEGVAEFWGEVEDQL